MFQILSKFCSKCKANPLQILIFENNVSNFVKFGSKCKANPLQKLILQVFQFLLKNARLTPYKYKYLRKMFQMLINFLLKMQG